MALADDAVTYQHNGAIDAASLDSYSALLRTLNDLVLKAADQRLTADAEPADFERLVLRPGAGGKA